MATYFTGSESPAASGGRGGGSSNNYLRNLSQLAESEGRSRYYDYLMGAPERDEAKYERVKEDSREEFRLGLKTKAIVESINNRQHQNDFNALTGLLGVSNDKMIGANAVLESKLGYKLATDRQLNSREISAYIDAWGKQNPQLAANPKEAASFTAALNEFASAQSSSTRILNNLKGVGGVRFDKSGKLLGITPITTLKDFYASEFGVNPITNIAVPKADKVAAPSEKDVEAAVKDVEETESVLTNAGALDSVAEDKPVSDEWINVAADWVAETQQEVPQSELPGGTDQSGVYSPEEGEVTSRPLTGLEMLYESQGIDSPPGSMVPDYLRSPQSLQSLEPSESLEELTLDQRLNPESYPDLNRDTSAGPFSNSEFYPPTGEEISRTVLPEYLSGGYEGYEMGDGNMSGRISPEEMPTEIQLPPLPASMQYVSERAPEDLPNYPVEDNPDYMAQDSAGPRELAALEEQQAIEDRKRAIYREGLLQQQESLREEGDVWSDYDDTIDNKSLATEALSYIDMATGVGGVGKALFRKFGWNAVKQLFSRGAKGATDDISNLAVEVGKRGRGFPARTPSYGSPHAIPPGLRGRGFPAQPAQIQPMTNPSLAVPPALRGRGFPTP
tara:strand:- start:10168 stop:12021 length:1854 start_codon:yes stop_codon:yes gene_type:complete